MFVSVRPNGSNVQMSMNPPNGRHGFTLPNGVTIMPMVEQFWPT